jgi:hypothetical protein
MSEALVVRDTARYGGTDTPAWRWSMIIDGETVSELWVAPETGEIAQVETPSRYQRLGYASALYRAAAAGETIWHAPAGHRTPEGDRFAASVGGEDFPYCLHGCCDDTPDFDDDED